MKKTNNTTNEEKTLLKPFPLKRNEKYLLKLSDGRYVVADWEFNGFISHYDNDNSVEEEIESIVSLKELGL